MAYRLYHQPGSRSDRCRWLLEELKQPYEVVLVNLAKGENRRADYRKIHPHGKVPVLQDDAVLMFESAAICAYLADKHLAQGLAPSHDSRERALYWQWMFYAVATLDVPSVRYYWNTVMLAPEKRKPDIVKESEEKLIPCLDLLNRTLRGKQYLLGKAFSAADIMVGSCIKNCEPLIAPYAELQRYLQDITSRPAYQRVKADGPVLRL